MRVDYNIKENVLGLVNEPQILEFDDRKKWTKSNEVEINEKVKVISLFSGSGGLDLGFLETGKLYERLKN